MPKVTYRNIFEEHSEFKEIEASSLIGAAYEYAKQESDEIYDAVLRRKVAIFINGEPVPVDAWASKKVEEDDEIVIVSRLSGGGNKLIGFIMIAAAVAVMAFAPEIAGMAFVQQLGITSGQIFLFGVSMALSGLMRLMFTPDLPTLPSIGGGKETPTYNWSGIQTTARPDMAVPIVYGTCPVGGNIINAFTENEGNNNYLYMLLALCEGEIDGICQLNDHTQVCSTSDTTSSSYKEPAIYINDQPLSNYDEVQWWYRTGTNTEDTLKDEYYPFAQNPIPKMDSIKFQVQDGREITTDWIEYDTQREVDAVTVTVQADSLYRIHGNDFDPCKVEYRIQFKEESESSWHDAEIKAFTPHLFVRGLVSQEYENSFDISYADGDEVKYDYKRPTYTVRFTNLHVHGPYYHFGPEYVFYTIEDEDGNIIHPLHGPLTFFSTGLDTYITVQEYKVYVPRFIYENQRIILSSTETTTTTFQIKEASKTPVKQSYTIDFKNNTYGSGTARYKIRIARTNEPSSQSTVADTIKLASVTEIIYGNFIYPNTALLGLKIKATGQLSGSIPTIKTIIRGKKVPVPTAYGTYYQFDELYYNEDLDRFETTDGTPYTHVFEGYWHNEYSENPMLCVRDLLTNTRYGIGKYTQTDDLYLDGIEYVTKQCHKKWGKGQINYLSWYQGAGNSEWYRMWHRYWPVPGSYINGYANTRQIILTGRASTFDIVFSLRKPLSVGISHTFSINISGFPTEMGIYSVTLLKLYTLHRFTFLAESHPIYRPTTDTFTLIFTPTISGIKDIVFRIEFPLFKLWHPEDTINMTISDVSLTDDVSTPAEHYHTFNGVIDSKQEILTALFEMCDAFRCWPVWQNGKFNFVLDEDESPVHLISMGDVKEFSQTFVPISEIPYKIYGQYLDKDDEYRMRQLVVRTTDTSIAKTREKTVGLKWITDRKRAERELKFKINKSTNISHMIKFKCGIDKLHATAGDIINFQHQLPDWGSGGRLLGQNGKTLTLDESYTIEDTTKTYIIKYVDPSNTLYTATLNLTGVNNGDEIQSVTVASLPAIPASDSIYAIGQVDSIKPFRILTAIRNSVHEVEVSAIEHLNTVYTSEDIVVVDDVYSNLELPNRMRRPSPPKFSVVQIDPVEGIGFRFYVEVEQSDNVKDIVVEWSTTSSSKGFTTLLIMGADQKIAKYTDNNLRFGKRYYFRAYARTEYTTSRPAYGHILLIPIPVINPPPSPVDPRPTTIDPPVGLKILGQTPNTHYFDSKDITITWNPVGNTPENVGIVVGYVVEIYHDSINSANLLRTDFTSSEIYTYPFATHISDSPTGNPYPVLIFVIYTKISNGNLSKGSTPFKVINSTPPIPSGLISSSTVGGVTFEWSPSTAEDHKNYKYRIRVGGTEYTSWASTINTNLTYSLTATQIETYSNTASVTLFLKDVDAFNQESTTASITGNANIITDYVFNQGASASDGSGNVASLYDGVTDSGGLTI